MGGLHPRSATRPCCAVKFINNLIVVNWRYRRLQLDSPVRREAQHLRLELCHVDNFLQRLSPHRSW